jgi:hypothetical protein
MLRQGAYFDKLRERKISNDVKCLTVRFFDKFRTGSEPDDGGDNENSGELQVRQPLTGRTYLRACFL